MDVVRRTLRAKRQGSFYATHGSASGPTLVTTGWKLLRVLASPLLPCGARTGRAAPHFLFTNAANPAPAGWDMLKNRALLLALAAARQRLFLIH